MRQRTVRIGPPGIADRLWHRRLGTQPPIATGHAGPRHPDWVRLLPYRWTRFHRAYAAYCGLFWGPCVLCGEHFGGHQFAGTVLDPTRAGDEGTTRGVSICPVCTKARADAGLETDI